MAQRQASSTEVAPSLTRLLAQVNTELSPRPSRIILRLAVPGEACIVFAGFLSLLAWSSHPLW